MLPIIRISDLQKGAGKILASVKNYAVVQSHGRDRAFILSPALGRLLLETKMLEKLQTMLAAKGVADGDPSPMKEADVERELKDLIGNVLHELSKR